MNHIKDFFSLHSETTDQLLHRLGVIVSEHASNTEKQHLYTVLGMVLLAHSGDTRRRPDTCTDHLLRTTICLYEIFGYENDLMIATLLHDILEDHPEFLPTTPDTSAQLSYLKTTYGQRVAHIVETLTNPPEVADEEVNRPMQHDKYHAHLEHIFHNEDALIVKFCDYLDNVITTGLSTNEILKRECTPRYMPLLKKYKHALTTMQRSHIFKELDVEAYFKDIEDLFT